MAATSPNTIILKGQPVRGNAQAAGTITPGDLIEFTGAETVQRNSNGGRQAVLAVAVESPYQQAAGTAAIDIVYETTSNKDVRYAFLQAGDEFYGFLKVGGSVAAATMVGSNGDGTFDTNPGTATGSAALAMALEAKDNSAGTVKARLKLMAL